LGVGLASVAAPALAASALVARTAIGAAFAFATAAAAPAALFPATFAAAFVAHLDELGRPLAVGAAERLRPRAVHGDARQQRPGDRQDAQ
jgi:hypothetical protein